MKGTDYNCNLRQTAQVLSRLFRGSKDQKCDLIPLRYPDMTGKMDRFIDVVVFVLIRKGCKRYI
jgi:hypothetical protein